MAIKFLDWYLKIAIGSAIIGGSMELFMIKTGFCIWFELLSSILTNQHKGSWIRYLTRLRKHKGSTLASKWLYKPLDDKVTVLESEKRAWENSPEAQAMREALNPWRNHDAQERKSS
ncbi:DNA mismatch repair mutS [Gossypium arboreum]|uniref:DNA mismatch repair mutS n=1 Tax=Gossypium arboreum TaxID=29729 RepID=A0A0B0NMR0_GOSAR|nr:DNA mismatch repair mutS [Gossypium arboreum]